MHFSPFFSLYESSYSASTAIHRAHAFPIYFPVSKKYRYEVESFSVRSSTLAIALRIGKMSVAARLEQNKQDNVLVNVEDAVLTRAMMGHQRNHLPKEKMIAKQNLERRLMNRPGRIPDSGFQQPQIPVAVPVQIDSNYQHSMRRRKHQQRREEEDRKERVREVETSTEETKKVRSTRLSLDPHR